MFHPVKRSLTIKGFYTFFDFCYAEDYFFGGEHHPFWEVVYCLSGTAGVSADEKIYRLRQGDLIVHSPNVHHKLWSEENTRAQVLVFSFDAEGAALDTLSGAYSCNADLQKQWNGLFYQMKECGYEAKCTGFLHYLDDRPEEYQRITNLCEINLLALEKQGLPLGTNQSKNALDYERIIQAMQQNIVRDLTVDELGKECNLSVSTMKKLFRHFNSMGIHEYFLHLKMKEAVRLLGEGKTVTETAELLGFSNQSYFSTAFKREMKEIPGRFKRNNI